MIHKVKIIVFILLLTVINTQCQNMGYKNIDITKATIKIDSCGIYYKGQRLDLGLPISEWEKVLGKPSRTTDLTQVWDSLGIGVDDWQNENKGEIAAFYIYFLNLDSPEGQSGQLNHARDWEPFNEKDWDIEYLKYNEERLKEKAHPKNYVYPYTIYNGYVDLHGFPVGAGMKVVEINSYREDLSFSSKFGYVDDDIDGVNDSGNTTETFGGNYRASGTECREGRLQYYELTYTANGALEYLKVGYESLSEFNSRKEREKK